jgi:hypothetical protein
MYRLDPIEVIKAAYSGVTGDIDRIENQFSDKQKIIDLFDEKVATAQRGLPESAMLKVQFAMSGGVLNGVVEHVGDLTHRMSERITADSRGYEYVKNKVEKTLRWLTNSYGFEFEMEENITHNAEYKNINEDTFRNKVYDALKVYAAEHRKIPVYNEAQWTAREAAIMLGERKWWQAVKYLRQLEKCINEGRESWVKRAGELQWPTPK